MNIVEKYKEIKNDKTPVKLIINSTIDYEDHDLNILRACLNRWAKPNHIPGIGTNLFKFTWMYTDLDFNEKLYFISTTVGDLKKMKMERIIDNPLVNASSYMDSFTEKMIYDMNNNAA